MEQRIQWRAGQFAPDISVHSELKDSVSGQGDSLVSTPQAGNEIERKMIIECSVCSGLSLLKSHLVINAAVAEQYRCSSQTGVVIFMSI